VLWRRLPNLRHAAGFYRVAEGGYVGQPWLPLGLNPNAFALRIPVSAPNLSAKNGTVVIKALFAIDVATIVLNYIFN